MLYYLDTAIVIYAVEGSGSDRQRTSDCLRLIEAAGHQFAISDLTRAECLVGATDAQTLADFTAFFLGPNTRTLVLGSAAYDRAAAIRSGRHFPATADGSVKRYGLADSLHLAVAIENGCGVFLTSDRRLTSFQGITVEMLP